MTGPMPDFSTSSDSIADYFASLLAHRMPAMTTTDVRREAHPLPAMVSSAAAPPEAHALAAMHSMARPTRFLPDTPMPSAPGMGLLADNAMPGSQSAIASLLATLTAPPPPPGGMGPPPAATGSPAPASPGPVTLNGISMPAPLAAPMPQVQAPQQQGMLGRIKGLLDPRPSAPSGYDGLLSEKEIASAKPGILQSLIGTPDAPSPSARYRGNLDHILELKQYAQGLTDQQTARQRAAAIQSMRVQAGQMFAAKPNETPQQTVQRMMQHGMFLLGQGDEEGGAKMVNAVGQLSKVLEGPTPKAIQHVDAGDRILELDGDGKIINTIKKGESPTPASAQLVTGADGRTFAYDPKNRSMQEVKTPDGQPFTAAPKAAAGGAANAAAEALLRSSVSEMGNADKFMQQYEQGLISGKYSINGVSQFLGGLGNAFTHDDPASRAIQNTALTTLNKVNPDLARYIRRGLSFAEGEAGISKRPSDFRTKMATFLSTAASGASKDMITDIQGRRASILNPLHDVVGKMAGAPAAAPSAAPSAPSAKRAITSDQATFLRTVKKMTDAQIAALYTVSP